MERFHYQRDFSRAIVFVPAARPAIVDALWNHPELLIEHGQRLTYKQCVRTTVKVDFEEESFVVKRHRERSLRHFAKQCFSRSRAAACWRDTWFLIDHGYPTPAPVVYRENRLGPLRGHSYYVYQYIPGHTLIDLATGLKNQRLLRQYVAQLVNIWSWHQRLRVVLNDGHPGNFIIDVTGKMWVIDLDKLHRIPEHVDLDPLLRQSFQNTLNGVFGDRYVLRYGMNKLDRILGIKRDSPGVEPRDLDTRQGLVDDAI